MTYHEKGKIIQNGVENSTITLYTVPVGFVFVLTALNLQNTCVSGNGQVFISVNGLDIAGNLGVALQNPILSVVLVKPVVFPAGSIFRLRSELAGALAQGALYGYESDNVALFQGN